MVSVTNLCGTLLTLCATMNNVPAEEVVAQISYDTVDSHKQIIEMVEEGATPYDTRNILKPEVVEQVLDYQEYIEEQERIQQEEMERQRLEEEERQRELASYTNKGYRQTYYSVEEGEISLGAGYGVKSQEVSVIDNVMNFYDKEYGWLPIYAINMDEVIASGMNEKGVWNLYGSIIQIKNEEGETWLGWVGDACGACRYSKKIDLWVYNNDVSMDITGLDWKVIRYGGAEE